MRYHVEVTMTLSIQAHDVHAAHDLARREIFAIPNDENVELVSLDVQANAQPEYPGIAAFATPPARSSDEPTPEELNRRAVEAIERMAGKRDKWEDDAP